MRRRAADSISPTAPRKAQSVGISGCALWKLILAQQHSYLLHLRPCEPNAIKCLVAISVPTRKRERRLGQHPRRPTAGIASQAARPIRSAGGQRVIITGAQY